MSQTRTSKETSINKSKLPFIYNQINFDLYDSVLDYGCGRYINHLKEKVGDKWNGYDPYWNIGEEIKSDLVICSNVLNVIDDDDTLINVIHRLFKLGKNVAIKIYEGPEANGVGRETKPDQWQRNERVSSYLNVIKKLGYEATVKGTCIYGKGIA